MKKLFAAMVIVALSLGCMQYCKDDNTKKTEMKDHECTTACKL
jgi:hypothetical protein